MLERESSTDGPASYASHLPHSPDKIIQAMKLWLAHDIRNRSLTQEFRHELGTAASRLPRFVQDDEARRLNTVNDTFSPATRSDLTPKDFLARATAVGEVNDWAINAETTGLSLRCELDDFVATVEQFGLADPLYWQRVYALAGLEYSPSSQRSGVGVTGLGSANQPVQMNRAYAIIGKEILRMAHGAFIFRLILTIGAYVGATFWLDSIRQAAAAWFVWVLIALQFLLFITIFVVCFLRAKQCGFRHTWLLFIPLVLSRVNNWEVVVIPAFAVIMFILSARNRNVPLEHLHLLPSASDPAEPDVNNSDATGHA